MGFLYDIVRIEDHQDMTGSVEIRVTVIPDKSGVILPDDQPSLEQRIEAMFFEMADPATPDAPDSVEVSLDLTPPELGRSQRLDD
jgi:hypothetical protein